jgi:hypothetical protein
MQAGAIVSGGAKVKSRLSPSGKIAMGSGMGTPDDRLSREERLAAKLRENLRRRKSQAKALAAKDDAPLPKGEPNG